jgi:hypothetical protein
MHLGGNRRHHHLHHFISALRQGDYGLSPPPRLAADALGGNCITTFISTLRQGEYEVSSATLKCATTARYVRNFPIINNNRSAPPPSARLPLPPRPVPLSSWLPYRSVANSLLSPCARSPPPLALINMASMAHRPPTTCFAFSWSNIAPGCTHFGLSCITSNSL